MKTAAAIGVTCILALALTGCGYERVPPGHKGKVLGPGGYSPELLETGKHWVGWNEQLVLLDLTTNVMRQTIKVTMRDEDAEGRRIPGLDMAFEVSLRYRLKGDQSIIQTMFNDLKVDPQQGVTAPKVYSIYAAPVVQAVFRDIVGEYTPEEAFANRAVLSRELGEALQARLARSPLEISDVLVVSATLPALIVKRIETNKDRELAIASEQAQQAIELVKRQNAIVLAQKDAERALIDAQAASAQNRELAKGLTPEVLQLRELEIQRLYVDAIKARMESGSGDMIFMPFEAMQSTGAQMRMFQGGRDQ